MATTNPQQAESSLKRLLYDGVVPVLRIAAYVAIGPALLDASGYLGGWGYNTNWLEKPVLVYICVIAPLLIFRSLYSYVRPTLYQRLLLFVFSIVLTIVGTVMCILGSFSIFGWDNDLELLGLRDHIEHSRLGPELVSWAREVANQHRSERLEPGYKEREYGYHYYEHGSRHSKSVDPPYRIRSLIPKDTDTLIVADLILDPKLPPQGVVIHFNYYDVIVILTSPSVNFPTSGDTLRPYPGIIITSFPVSS